MFLSSELWDTTGMIHFNILCCYLDVRTFLLVENISVRNLLEYFSTSSILFSKVVWNENVIWYEANR